MTLEADTLSTTIDTDPAPAAGGGGQVVEQAEPASLRGDLEAVFKEEADKPAKVEKTDEPSARAEGDEQKPPKGEEQIKPDGKPEQADVKKDDAKPERQRADDGKFAAREKDEPQKGERRFVEAPQSFLPHAKEVWRNTPHAVQQEVARLVQEAGQRDEQTRAAVERYDSIRQFDELARSNGRDLRQSLERMGQVEDLLQRNPIAGLNAILQEIGPRKADGQAFSLMEVAQFIAQQDPNQYQQMVAQPRQQEQQREDPRVAQLQQQIERQTHDNVVAPFMAANPRFAELESDIAFFLQSGRIPESLSPQDRLAAAYDMAERINPPSHVENAPAARLDPAAQRRADDDFSGSKSIKSSPGSVEETYEPEAKRGESARDSLLAELRRMNR